MKLRKDTYWIGCLVMMAVSFLPGSCTKVEPGWERDEGPHTIAFEAYLSRGVATRAGTAGELTSAGLGTAGFGVFGYHTVNALYGDPMVAYKASFDPTAVVDLCWGVPHLNMLKPAVAEKVSFTFQHALSALNVQVDAITDATEPAGEVLDAATRIYIRSVTFEGFALSGMLNLGGTNEPQWYGNGEEAPLSSTPVTVHDGRLNGREAVYDNVRETPVGLNPSLVQQEGYNTMPGATSTVVNLFDSNDLSGPVYVIPKGIPLKVNLVYDVETQDDKLSDSFLSDGTTHGHVIRTAVSQAIVTASGPVRMVAGRRYVLKIHLGMTSVKFEVGVTDDWVGLDDIRFELIATGHETDTPDLEDNWI